MRNRPARLQNAILLIGDPDQAGVNIIGDREAVQFMRDREAVNTF